MCQEVAFLAGISGVGKTTFLKMLSASSDFQSLTASSIIKDQQKYEALRAQSSEDLRQGDISDNQRLMASGFERLRDKSKKLVIVDGHTIIASPSGIVKLNHEVFEPLALSRMVFLYENASLILERRIGDIGRERPQISIDEIKEHQSLALTQAADIANILGICLGVFNSKMIDEFTEFVNI